MWTFCPQEMHIPLEKGHLIKVYIGSVTKG